MNILQLLLQEKNDKTKSSLYHQTQLKFSFNTNRMEGSKLSEEQTRYIYETNTLFTEIGNETTNVDDIIETVNHFSCFDYMLDIGIKVILPMKKWLLYLGLIKSELKETGQRDVFSFHFCS